MKVLHALLKLRDIIEKYLLIIVGILMCTIACLIGLQIVLRTIGIGIDWTEEFARFSFTSLAFLGSVIAITKNRHIVIDFLIVLFPDIVRRWFLVVIHFLMAGFMVICIKGLSIIISAASGVPSNSVSWFMLSYIYMVVLVGCILMCYVSILRALEFAVLKKELPPPQGT